MNRIRDQRHYIPELKKHFPQLTEEQLTKIVREGLYQLQFQIIAKKKDVVLKNTFKKLSLTFFKFIPSRLKKKNYGDTQKQLPDS